MSGHFLKAGTSAKKRLAELIFRHFEPAELAEPLFRGRTGLLKVAAHRLCDMLVLLFFETDLKGFVSVTFLCLDLRYEARARLDDGAGNRFTPLVKDAGHAYFFTEDTVHCFFQ